MITESINNARQILNDLQKVYDPEELLEMAKRLDAARFYEEFETSYATQCLVNLIYERHFK